MRVIHKVVPVAKKINPQTTGTPQSIRRVNLLAKYAVSSLSNNMLNYRPKTSNHPIISRFYTGFYARSTFSRGEQQSLYWLRFWSSRTFLNYAPKEHRYYAYDPRHRISNCEQPSVECTEDLVVRTAL